MGLRFDHPQVPLLRYIAGRLLPADRVDALDRGREAIPESSAVRAYKRQHRALERQAPVQDREVLLVRHIMTADVVVVQPGSRLSDARELLASHRFHHIPVVSEGGQIAGILSDRDVMRALNAPEETPVSEIMTTSVFATLPDARVQHVASLMLEHVIGSLPVVNPKHDIVGIVTTTDILRAVVERGPVDFWA